jgi:enoyl-CoA hydratase/carnithine racemase
VILEGDWSVGPLSHEACAWLDDPDVMTVAALSGTVTATGLALACDLRVVTVDTRFRFTPVPDGAGPLVAAVGLARATHWCLAGVDVDAAAALAAGLVSQVVPESELMSTVDDLVAQVLRHPRPAVVEGKALLQGAGRRTAGEQWKAESEARARVLQEE